MRNDATERALHEPDTLVRFAWAAQLDAYRTRPGGTGRTGRQELARALSISEPRLSALAAQGGDRLASLVDELEQRGFAEHGSVSRLAEALQLRAEHRWSVSPRWWPILRDQHRLGRSETTPRFATPFEVVLVAEAFSAFHAHLLHDPPNIVRSELSDADQLACRQLLASLCRLGSGPYGVAHDALRLVARLAPLEPDVVAEYVRLGGPRSQLIRAWERSERTTRWNSNVRQEFASLLATPPPLIFRRVFWIRGLRRLRLSDNKSGDLGHSPRNWVTKQLRFAVFGERGYRGARATDRRFALWVAAEVTLDELQWSSLATDVADDPVLASLLPLAQELRAYLADQPLARRDAFWFTPRSGWPVLTTHAPTAEVLDVSLAKTTAWSQYGRWRWARRATRWMAALLIRDGVLAPCAVRQRSAAEALFAGGPESRRSASGTIADLLAAELSAPVPHPVIVQRCLVLLGMLRCREGIQPVEDFLRAPLVDEVDGRGHIAQALTTAGALANAHPEDSVGLVAWAVRRAADHADDEDVALAAIHALVGCGKDPAVELAGRLVDTPTVESSLSWAAEVFGDELFASPSRPR
ncbi:MAG: hypothetical protein R2715_07260 [Ilumatobacteraceae bacterium]